VLSLIPPISSRISLIFDSATAEGAHTKAEAEAILRRKILEYENAGTVFKPQEITLHDYLDFWMKEYVDLKLEPNTYYNYESTIRNHIAPHLGKYKVKTLTPHVLQQFINLKTREGYARQTLSIIIGIKQSFESCSIHLQIH